MIWSCPGEEWMALATLPAREISTSDGVTGSAICSRVPAEEEGLLINELMV